MIKAAIYDMDGTLVDTEHLGLVAWDKAAEQLGADVPRELAKQFIGRARPSVVDMLVEHLGSRPLSEAVYDLHRDIQFELSKEQLDTKPGAIESLRALHEEGYRIALATSSRRQTVDYNLNRFGIMDLFEVITCGDEMERGKPHPDIYLLTAERLGIDPVECAVIEDSANGVKAGHAAGMHVYMVPDVLAPTDELIALCDRVLKDLFELPGALREDGGIARA